jgi:hypothetical protein
MEKTQERPGSEASFQHPAQIASLWLFGLICLLLPAAVILYQLNSPSDGARISKQADAWTPQGVIIHTYPGEGSGLQDGDEVIAVNGTSLETWMAGLFSGGAGERVSLAAQTVVYRVLRGGKLLDQPVRAVPQPVWAILRAHWGVYLYAIVSQLIAIFVILRRPAEAPARALFVWGMTCSHFYIWSFYRQVLDLTSPSGFWLYTLAASFLWLSNWAAGLHLALAFPQPFPAIRRRPVLLALPYLASFLLFGLYLVVSRDPAAGYTAWIVNWQRGETLVPIAMFIPIMGLMFQQYRRNQSGASRKKIRLIVFSGILGGVLTVFFYLLPPIVGLPALDANLLGIVLLLFPIAIAIAILRYQLFDIDVIIRRTLVYSILTTLLALIYFVSVVVLQQVFGAFVLENSAPIVVATTLAIAALFTPLRRRIQLFIDRRFYRQVYNSEQIIALFSRRLRAQINMDQLNGHILEVVQETLNPESVSLWIFTPGKQPFRTTGPSGATPARR